eukprot:TRINITY_DN1693_c0_g1_i2.p1 TRINITY_DN1693_c0_g1~~TRINITY_DN1693_c0_g1_i2.p1  ORF type:complete len:336 (+),score=75.22 TRINITY_DN1693_c0_g1_i2:233-1240(+)
MDTHSEVFVGGLVDGTTTESIVEEFGKFGAVEHVRLKSGYGFVQFRERESAERAVSHKDQLYCGGTRPLTVRWSTVQNRLLIGNLEPTVDLQDILESTLTPEIMPTSILRKPGCTSAKLEFSNHVTACSALKILQKVTVPQQERAIFASWDDHDTKFKVYSLYVSNLNESMTKEDIEMAFAPFPFSAIKMASDFKRDGFCFVEFPGTVEAEKCLEALGGQVVVKGVNLIVRLAKPSQRRRKIQAMRGSGPSPRLRMKGGFKQAPTPPHMMQQALSPVSMYYAIGPNGMSFPVMVQHSPHGSTPPVAIPFPPGSYPSMAYPQPPSLQSPPQTNHSN